MCFSYLYLRYVYPVNRTEAAPLVSLREALIFDWVGDARGACSAMSVIRREE
jgi:hypothetical protein